MAKKMVSIRALKKKNLEMARQRDAALDKCKAKNSELYEVKAENEELKEQIRKLKAQLNKDFENSSLPSSLQGPKRKKIPNSRENTGRKPGGQAGHTGHVRKKHVPNETVELPAPKEYEGNPDFYATGKVICKQKVFLEIMLRTVEYRAQEYRNRKTGVRVHAPFPEGYVNEVNYDSSIKALAYLLRNEGNVSIDKVRRMLCDLTDGELDLSEGFVNNLCEEFSRKTEAEKAEIVSRIMSSPVMNADFTSANVNGKSAQVLVLASAADQTALYIAREHKGHAGVKDTPLESFGGTVVHDHDTTFYSYGTGHQECIQHDIRYLKGSIENEKDLTWNSQMLELVREMLHYRNNLGDGELDAEKVDAFERRYDEILEKAREEYENEPPSDYYREGYNLYRRLVKYKENELLFLHDKNVPSNNSLCERLARQYKRKQRQAIVIRSQDYLEYICNGLSVIHFLRQSDKNVYQEMINIFNRQVAQPKAENNEQE